METKRRKERECACTVSKRTQCKNALTKNHKYTGLTNDLCVSNIVKDGSSMSMIRIRIGYIFKWQAQEANKFFNKLGLQETLEDFF
jgi:hypothetical protein